MMSLILFAALATASPDPRASLEKRVYDLEETVAEIETTLYNLNYVQAEPCAEVWGQTCPPGKDTRTVLPAVQPSDDARLAVEVANDDAQAWFCEDYLADGASPVAGCLWEGGRVSERDLLCRGPVAVIADDDPGLALYATEIAASGLEDAKVQLAFDRGESCDDSEQNILEGASVSTIAAAVEHVCINDEKGCAVLRAATHPQGETR